MNDNVHLLQRLGSESATFNRKWMPGGGGGGGLDSRSHRVQKGVAGHGATARCGEIVGGLRSQFKHNDSSFTYLVDEMFFTESEKQNETTV